MTAAVEKGSVPVPETGSVTVNPETLSEEIEKIVPGVQVTQSQFKNQVTDDQGQPLITTPQTEKVTIELPKTEEVFLEESKGDIGDSRTWLARFWLRVIQKAKYFGWQIASLVKPKIGEKNNA